MKHKRWVALVAMTVTGCGTMMSSHSDDPRPPVAGQKDDARAEIAARRDLGRAFVEDLLNAKSPEAYRAALVRIVSPDYIQHNPLVPPGRDGLAQFSQVLGASFPDAHATLQDAFATPDRVVARWTFTGTLTGRPFLGVTATGQRLEFSVIDIWTVKGNQLYEHWDELDWTTALVQLGVQGVPAAFVETARKH